MDTRDPIVGVVGRAQRRTVINRSAAAATLGACSACAAAILILFFGTSILHWAWIALAGAAGLAFAVVKYLRRVPTAYETAQLVDDRLSLRDALSTAIFFAEPGGRMFDAAMRHRQRESALAAAASADIALAVPYVVPRNIYLLGILLLAMVGTGILRFGLQHTLDLRAPLTQALFDSVSGQPARDKTALAKNGQANRDFKVDPAKPDTGTTEEHPEEAGTFDPAKEESLQTIEVPEVDNSKAEASPKGGNKGDAQQEAESQSPDAEQNENSGQGNSPSEGSDTPGVGKGMKPEKGSPPNAMSESPTLSAKLKDAFQNLLSTIKPKSGAGQGKPQPGDQQQKGDQQQQQQAGGGQKGSASPGQQQSQQAGEGQQADGDDAQQSESKQAQASGKGNNDQSSHSPGSGMGKQDGAKDVKLAEQLAAMGKISEIIGKRSLAVSGETTLEVPQSKQQLRTAYVNSQAAHGHSGGEVSRDEVPAAAQEYVQRYFEKVRPATAAALKRAAPAAAPKPNVPTGDKGER